MPSRKKARKKVRQTSSAGSELALIEHIRRRARGRSAEVRLAIGDDCAILKVRAGEEMVVTTDLSLEGRHFRRDWHPAASIGHRALARGLSDIAAMGARPVAAFLSLALPRAVAVDQPWVDGFLDGLLALASQYGVPLAGGDTAEAPGDAIIADIVLLGAAPSGCALRRSGARPGDLLYCTGSLGGAAAELAGIQASPGRFASAQADGTHPHLFPDPRLAAGRALLRRRLATACIDLSDGLSTDLLHLCKASHVAAEVEAGALPLRAWAGALQAPDRLPEALHGGEDYELLFTAPPSARVPRRLGGVAVTRIGRIVAHTPRRPKVLLIDANGRRTALKPSGWEHFRS